MKGLSFMHDEIDGQVTVVSGIGDAVDEYLATKVNFGADSFELRMAETDAFVAGWTACAKLFSQ